jgi:hypothetical protein
VPPRVRAMKRMMESGDGPSGPIAPGGMPGGLPMGGN